MCAKHRSQVLAEVRQLLKAGQPCRLVATSLIEAGVDVDFPVVLRAEAGLDSIAQAAGRCNREGQNARDASEVLVFSPANPDWKPPAEVRQLADAAAMAFRNSPTDPLSLDALKAYFEEVYWTKGEEALDKENLLGLLKRSQIDSLPMETLAEKFRMIDDTQVTVIIPFDCEADSTLSALRFSESCVGLARRLQPYGVQISRKLAATFIQSGAVRHVEPQKWGDQFLMLANKDLYELSAGLRLDNPNFMRAENLVC